MSNNSVDEKLKALSHATESFRATKKKMIAQICSVGAKHKILKYPSLAVAFLFIFFIDIAFYICLFVMVNKKRAIGVGIVIVALIGLVVVLSDYNSSNRLYEKTQKNYTTVMAPHDDEKANAEDADAASLDASMSVTETPTTEVEWYEKINVDFSGLKETNEDIVGWIYFEDEEISYPILQGDTNDVYLKTSYLGKASRAGSIFLDCKNGMDFEDFHSLIYGHNMRDKSMFGKLSYYREDTAYYNGHEYFQIITPSKKFRYEIIACKSVKEDNPIYDLSNVDQYECNEYLQNMILKDSMLGIGLTAYERDHFVTLSTCTTGENRFIVSAFRISEREVE